MSIFKLKSANGFTQFDNEVICTAKIYPSAKSVLLYLLSKPFEWKVFIADIVKQLGFNRKTVQRAIRELNKLGYIVRVKFRKANGQFGGFRYDVYPVAQRFEPQTLFVHSGAKVSHSDQPPRPLGSLKKTSYPQGGPPQTAFVPEATTLYKKKGKKKEVNKKEKSKIAAFSFNFAKRALQVFCNPSDKTVNQVLELVRNPNKFKALHKNQKFKFNTIIKQIREGTINLDSECEEIKKCDGKHSPVSTPKKDLKPDPINALKQEIEAKERHSRRLKRYTWMDTSPYERELIDLRAKLEDVLEKKLS